MKKTWMAFIAVLLLTILSVFLYIETISVRFSVQNNIPGYEFRVSSLAGNLFLYSQGYKTNFKNVNIIFTSEKQTGFQLLAEGPENPTASMNAKVSGSTMTIWEQYDQNALISALGTTEVNGYKVDLEKDLYSYLCMVIDPSHPGRDNCYKKAENYIRKLGPLSSIKIVNTSRPESFKLISRALAGCTGIIECGMEVTTLRCSGNHADCKVERSPCSYPDTGTCQYETYCNISLNNNNCDRLDTQALCEAVYSSSWCGPTRCNMVEQSCTWGTGGGGGTYTCVANGGVCSATGTCPGEGLHIDTSVGTCPSGENCCIGSTTPTSPPAPVNNPLAYHDNSFCDYSYGWACDADNYAQALTINFYKDGPPGTGTFIGSTLANVPAEVGVSSQCGGYADHRFNFKTPDSLKDGVAHTIYAQAVNIGSTGSNVLATDTPKTITCNSPKGNHDGILCGYTRG